MYAHKGQSDNTCSWFMKECLCGMFVQQVHAACSCGGFMQRIRAAGSFNKFVQSVCDAGLCSGCVQQFRGTCTCSGSCNYYWSFFRPAFPTAPPLSSISLLAPFYPAYSSSTHSPFPAPAHVNLNLPAFTPLAPTSLTTILLFYSDYYSNFYSDYYSALTTIQLTSILATTLTTTFS